MITITNINAGGTGEYIGRPSILGNPFVIGKDGTRKECVEKYSEYFVEQMKLNKKFNDEFHRLVNIVISNNLTLACWCSPQLCHGHIIKKF
jgi:hypothetical protein